MNRTAEKQTKMMMMGDEGLTSIEEGDDYDDSDDQISSVEEDEDEDFKQLSEYEKRKFMSSLMYYDNHEPYFCFPIQRLYSKYFSKHPNYFLGIKRDAAAEYWVSQLAAAQVSWNKQHISADHAKETLVKSQLIYKLQLNAKYHFKWDKVRTALLPDNQQLYSHTIKAAADLLCTLWNKDFLYKFGRRCTMYEQKVSLWNTIRILRLKGCSMYEVFENIVRLTASTDKYSFLTEPDLADIICESRPSINPIPFSRVARDLCLEGLAPRAAKEHTIILNQILSDIDKVVKGMELSFPSFQVDDYTRLLVRLLKRSDGIIGSDGLAQEDILSTQLLVRLLRESVGVAEASLVSDAMIVDTKAMDQQKIIYSLLDNLLYRQISMMKSRLGDVIQPLFILSGEILGRRFVSHEVLMIVQVAELRRMALGRCFIGRSHLIWAFYECGYGLLTMMNTAYVISQDKDHPPYHIYAVAMKLAAVFKLTKVRLEHFMFAVLFAQESIFHWSKNQWSEMKREFKNFEKAIDGVKLLDIPLHKTEGELESSNSSKRSWLNAEENRITDVERV